MATASDASVCVNIGPKQRRQRLLFGVGLLGFGVMLVVPNLINDGTIALRLLCGLFWWLGALGVIQALERTCIALARRGVRNLDAGEEPVSGAEHKALRRRARNIHIKAAATGLGLTLLTLLR
jgi:hypothetical protein